RPRAAGDGRRVQQRHARHGQTRDARRGDARPRHRHPAGGLPPAGRVARHPGTARPGPARAAVHLRQRPGPARARARRRRHRPERAVHPPVDHRRPGPRLRHVDDEADLRRWLRRGHGDGALEPAQHPPPVARTGPAPAPHPDPTPAAPPAHTRTASRPHARSPSRALGWFVLLAHFSVRARASADRQGRTPRGRPTPARHTPAPAYLLSAQAPTASTLDSPGGLRNSGPHGPVTMPAEGGKDMRRVLAAAATLSVAFLGAVLPATGATEDRVGWDRSDAPDRVLQDGSAQDAGLVQRYLDDIEPALQEGLTTTPTPLYPGAVALVASRGVVAERTAVGHAVRWADTETELPAAEQVEMRTDTIFDLASLSKLFTAVAVMQLVEDGAVALDGPAAAYSPAFAANGKESVTVEQLLTHTGGLPAWINLYSAYDDVESRLAAVYAVQPSSPPGTQYVYSDLGLIVLGKIVEEVSGLTLEEYVATHLTGPLGMDDTMYNPPAELRDRIAATEYQPLAGRGLVHGEVHDENAWSLGGVAGHAGVFSTADDVAVFAQMLLNGGSYAGAEVLAPETVATMMRDYTGHLSSAHRGLGPELEAWFYHDVLTSAESAGHTGFTGTSLVIDPHTETIAVLLTNRVHPSRDWGSINPVRRAVARAAGLAHPLTGFPKGSAWYSGIGDLMTNDLTVPVTLDGSGELVLDLWFHTEPTDRLHVEASTDGGATWDPLTGTLTAAGQTREVPGSISGDGLGRWWEGRFDLGDRSGDVELRLRYAPDTFYSGRGVYLDRIRVTDGGAVAFDDWDLADRDTVRAEGWTRVDATGAPAPEPVEEWRGYWVDAFNPGIYTPAQVSALVEDALEVGANALIVQVGRRY